MSEGAVQGVNSALQSNIAAQSQGGGNPADRFELGGDANLLEGSFTSVNFPSLNDMQLGVQDASLDIINDSPFAKGLGDIGGGVTFSTGNVGNFLSAPTAGLDSMVNTRAGVLAPGKGG